MPFCFVYICDLLDQLERLETLDPPIILPQLLDHKRNERIISWFKHHRKRIDAFDTDGDALLATLLPDRRTDRVYGLDNRRLEQVVARVLNLSIDRYAELRKWQEMDGPDLPRCVEQVMNAVGLLSKFLPQLLEVLKVVGLFLRRDLIISNMSCRHSVLNIYH